MKILKNMMGASKGVVLVLALIGVTSGCSIQAEIGSDDKAAANKIQAVGIGAAPRTPGLSDAQRMLLAAKASKMDAYRSLAEKVYGVSVSSNMTVRALAVENDSFKARVEGYIKMAEVKEVRPLGGGSYETVLELTLPEQFGQNVISRIQ